MFHFGLSIHSFWELDGDAAEWLKDFESLLRRMFWEHAQVLVSTEYMGNYHYLWTASGESELRYLEEPPSPAKTWIFRCDNVESLIESRRDS